MEIQTAQARVHSTGQNQARVSLPVKIGNVSYMVNIQCQGGRVAELLKDKARLVDEAAAGLAEIGDLSFHKMVTNQETRREQEFSYTATQVKEVSEEVLQQVEGKKTEMFASRPIRQDVVGRLLPAELRYLKSINDEAAKMGAALKGCSLHSRYEGAQKFVELRRRLASDLFENVVRPHIERLMDKHGESGSYNDLVTAYGFNRLFTRDKASAGTDIDFMLVINSDKQELIADIRALMQETVAPDMIAIGVDMETADYLMIDLTSYEAKLGVTRRSLFTLANMFNPLKEDGDNVSLLSGSEAQLRDRIFHFSDDQLMHHMVELLIKNGKINDSERPSAVQHMTKQLKGAESDAFRHRLVDSLQKMANSELYIGKAPYKGKKTIQTVLAKPELHGQREERSAPFSIKFCVNRIVDLVRATTLSGNDLNPSMSDDALDHLEGLGLLLSNIVCNQVSGAGAVVELQDQYSSINHEQLKSMTYTDCLLVKTLLAELGHDIDVSPMDSQAFADACYDALWNLADTIHAQAVDIETKIFDDALSLVTK